MRRHLYAGAVAAGFLLLGAAPAYADVQPAPADAHQDAGDPGGLLGSTNGIDLSNPLGGTSLLNVNPGDNSVLPPQDDVPPARTGFGQAGAKRDASGPGRRSGAAEKDDALPVPDGGLPTGALGQLPIASLLGGGLPVVGGLLPNGQSPLGSPADQESRLLDDGVPLLGGLGGLLPGRSARTLPAASGMPAGGTAVPADEPAQDAPDRTKPAQPNPQPAAADPAIANDHRLHEEPTDPEDKSDSRPFSGGRPIAGVDPDFS